jgi:hypothetical protein
VADLHSGLRTTYRAGGQAAILHVDWIAWDSGFRGSGLQVGDDIVAINGKPVAAGLSAEHLGGAIGQSGEAATWTKLDLRDGAALQLTARRRRIPGEGWDALEIAGVLKAEHTFQNSNAQRTFGQGGPARLERDGFDSSWASWYEKRVFDWERQLDGGVWSRGGDSRSELARHLESAPRVQFLNERYPGAFATAVLQDWELLHASLKGRGYEVPPEETAYREAEAKLTAAVTAASQAAWDAFRAKHADAFITVPGKLDYVAGDEARYAGNLLALPPAKADDWVTDVGRTFVSWRENSGWVFTPLESPASNRMWLAQERYRRHVTPKIADEFALIGQILPQSRLVSPKGRAAVTGLEVEPLAALMGRGDAQMFVDMTTHRDGVSPFAGEDAVRVIPSGEPPDCASAREVMQALISALYAGDEATWFALFADWHFASDEGRAFYYPFYPYPDALRGPDWIRSRRVVLEKTYALRIVWIDEPRIVCQSDATAGLPQIERVSVELDHVGLFDGQYRAFASSDVHRHWRLERRDGGPWRITTHQGI